MGRYFLDLQARLVRESLSAVPEVESILDVGGGHAQVAPVLAEAGYRVTVLGSALECFEHSAAQLARHEKVVGDLQSLPYGDDSFDAVLSLRTLTHLVGWRRLIEEACRVARTAVIVDYPSLRGLNALSDPLFPLKRRVEGNTRRYRLFSPAQIEREFSSCGFEVTWARPQFFFPMVLHRLIGSSTIASGLEALPRALGLTRWLGSPVVLRAAVASRRIETRK